MPLIYQPQIAGFWDVVGGVVKAPFTAATTIINAPVQMVKAVGSATTGILGSTGGLLRDAAGVPGQLIGGLRPQQQSPGAAALAALGGSSGSVVPIAIAGAGAVGLLIFALASKKGRRSRRR